ncbi:MAG: MaoC family dehydratase [Acidimicrobiales bacterium]|nr:MaoC family dehydratase [Acidimicrobiales bacterium]
MSTAAETAFETFQARVGQADGAGDWFEVTQDQINQFADVTRDHQFIHVDEEAAKAGPFGTTIAHGFLTLSMLTHLAASVPQDSDTMQGVIMGVNYGFDKVRFISPVPSGSRIRAASELKDVQLKDPDTIQVTRTYTIEVEGNDKPAVVADWITRLTYS